MKVVTTPSKDLMIEGEPANARSLEAIVASSGVSPSKFLTLFRKELKAVPDPDRALNNFLRFVSTGFTSTHLRKFSDNPVLLTVALTLFCQSQYLADILVRNPELLDWLMSTGILTRAVTAEEYKREARLAVAPFDRTEKKMDALKRFQRRQILRISARDILEVAGLESVTRDLSWLADSIVDTVVSTVFEDLNRRISTGIKPAFSVVGLGKLGGEELNFSSDIDLMFVYDQDGDLDFTKERIHTYHEYYCRAAETIVRCLTEHSTEGHLYRVDMRLRPDGTSGPLAMARTSYTQYYEARGELWERQMLLKARIVAGEMEVGQGLLRSLRPFIYPSTILHNPLEEIRRIKNRIESMLGEKHNVKLSRGGIRDIEFIVQALQMLRSGSEESLRETNTLRALEKLRNVSLLSVREAKELNDAYVFLRRVEHRLQLLQGAQTHEMPGSRKELQLLGRRMGFKSTPGFEKKHAQIQVRVRKIYDSVFRISPGGRSQSKASLTTSPSEIRQLILKFGFVNPESAVTVVGQLQKEFEGVRDPRLLKNIFGILKRKGAPDWGLKNFSVVASSSPAKRILEQAFENENALELLLTICARSSRLAQTLSSQPLFIESLLGRTEQFFQPGLEWNFLLPHDPFRFRLFNESKAAIRFLAGESSIEQTARDLTYIADTILRNVIENQQAEFRGAVSDMCVVALGKYGGQEILIDSDLDLLLIHRQAGEQVDTKYEKAAAEFLKLFKSEAGPIYNVDLRLRPEGKNAPLSTEFSYYEHYLTGRAELWEKQAMLKARIVFGNERLGGEMTSLRSSVLSDVAQKKGWTQQIKKMRERMEIERTREKTRTTDLKVGKGGLVDLEFAIQIIQLRHSERMGLIDAQNSFEAMRQVGTFKLLRTQELKSLESNYGFLRQLEFLIRLNSDSNDFVLPSDKTLLQALAAGMRLRTVKDFGMRIQKLRRENRAIFQKTIVMI